LALKRPAELHRPPPSASLSQLATSEVVDDSSDRFVLHKIKMAAVARQRIADLLKVAHTLLPQSPPSNTPCKVQCRIFSHTYNPTCVRTGNKVLRQRLKGPIVAAYYPPRSTTLRELQGLFPGLETYDDLESERIDSIAITRARGKGPPKKKRTAEGEFDFILLFLTGKTGLRFIGVVADGVRQRARSSRRGSRLRRPRRSELRRPQWRICFDAFTGVFGSFHSGQHVAGTLASAFKSIFEILQDHHAYSYTYMRIVRKLRPLELCETNVYYPELNPPITKLIGS